MTSMESLEYVWDVIVHIGSCDHDEVYVEDTLYMSLYMFIMMCCFLVPVFLFVRLIIRCFFSNLTEKYWMKSFLKQPEKDVRCWCKDGNSDILLWRIAEEIEKIETEDSERGRFFSSMDTRGDAGRGVVRYGVQRWLTYNCAKMLFRKLSHLGLGVKLYRRENEWKTPPADIENKME